MAGNLEKRGKDTWRIRIEFGRFDNGKRKLYSETFFGVKRDAEKRLTELLEKKNKGTFVWSVRMTLNNWLDEWLETHVKAGVARTTYGQYVRTAKLYIRPTIGTKLLSEIERGDVQSLYNKLTLQVYSSRTVRYAHAVLRAAYKDAVRAKKVGANPCIDLKLPKRKPYIDTVKSMTLEQAKAFIKASYDDPRGLIYRLTLETGMRMEETLGLKWEDIDFEGKKLTVKRVMISPKAKSEKWYFYTPKTTHSIRQIDLSDRILDELKAHRTIQLGQILQLGVEYQRNDLVFATDFGHPIDQANIRRRNFKRIMEAAGLSGFTPHKLRHTAASLMIARKEHPKVVQQRCGHSDVKFTIEVYSHLMPGMEKEAAERHAEALYG